jgi:hypothetical protein
VKSIEALNFCLSDTRSPLASVCDVLHQPIAIFIHGLVTGNGRPHALNDAT